MIFLARRYAMWPTSAQAESLETLMSCLRDLWNDAAAMVEHARRWQQIAGRSRRWPLPQAAHVWKTWQEVKRLDPACELAKLPGAAVSALSRAFDRAMQEGWAAIKAGRPPRWPRRKRIGDALPSIEFPVWTSRSDGKRHCNVKFGRDSIRFPNARGARLLGPVRYTRHKKIAGSPKTARILLDAGRWYCAISCEVPVRTPPERVERVLGIHLGIVHPITVSDGSRYELVRPDRKKALESKLKKAQRKLSRGQRGSNRRKKLRADLARRHAHLAALRRARQHEIAAAITSRCTVVAMEALDVGRMMRRAGRTAARNRELAAVAPAQMREILTQHLERRGGRIVIVDPAWTSSTCEVCGHVDGRSRRGATNFLCTACGHSIDADYNAARVIARIGSGLSEAGGNSGSVSGPRETDDGGQEPVGFKSRVRQNPIARAFMPRGGNRKSSDAQGPYQDVEYVRAHTTRRRRKYELKMKREDDAVGLDE